MSEISEEMVYTVEKILKKQIRKSKIEYFVKWKGWGHKVKNPFQNPFFMMLKAFIAVLNMGARGQLPGQDPDHPVRGADEGRERGREGQQGPRLQERG